MHSFLCPKTERLFNSDVVNGQRFIPADTAPRAWLNLQSEYDMRMVARQQEAVLA